MGIPEQEFFALDMREYSALCEAHEGIQRRDDLRAGLVASILTAMHSTKGTRIRQPVEWFAWHRKREQTVEEMYAVMKSFMGESGEPN